MDQDGTMLREISQKEKTKPKKPITVASKGIKYIGMNLAKEMKDLYLENYKSLMKSSSVQSLSCVRLFVTP